jgi:hypothetical protein
MNTDLSRRSALLVTGAALAVPLAQALALEAPA